MYSGDNDLEYYKSGCNLYDLFCGRLVDKYIKRCDTNLCLICRNDGVNDDDKGDSNENQLNSRDIEWKKLCEKCKNVIVGWFEENNFYVKLIYSGLVGDYDSDVEHHESGFLANNIKLITNDILYDNVVFDRCVKDVFDIDIEICSSDDNQALNIYKCENDLYSLYCNCILKEYNAMSDLCTICIGNEYDMLCKNCEDKVKSWVDNKYIDIKLKYEAWVGPRWCNVERHEIELPKSFNNMNNVTNELLYRQIVFDKWPRNKIGIDIII